jgi:16S rRNA A1518/A1519 N6-dimethyltransferase RsmA/KsgA/DIM1 with predicted DNA glycosylase/AP lyase activity
MNGSDLKKEFGDYQTPNQFAETICSLLYNELKLNPEVVIEPTSGLGNFIKAALNTFSTIKKIVGVEINPEYCDECKKRISDDRLHIVNDNFFTYKIEKYVGETETLFLGNPPWATNSELNFNLPEKENFKRLSGTDAITGASNFDICEYIILKLIEKSVNKNVAIAMLCKTSVARNVLLELDRNDVCVDDLRILILQRFLGLVHQHVYYTLKCLHQIQNVGSVRFMTSKPQILFLEEFLFKMEN